MATVEPFSPRLSTVNTTISIAAARSTVWPTLRAMDQWSTFQDLFSIELVNDDGVVELGQEIQITTNFPNLPPQVTLEEYNEIIEEERICWTLRGFVFGAITLPSPEYFLRTARCIELFDDQENNGTILHNWISYAGFGWPVVVLTTGTMTGNLFDEFNAALANQF